MYRDVWNYHKKYIDGIGDNGEYWQNVVDESNDIAKKYGECKFIINLLLAEMTEFERIYREVEENANAGV